MITKIDDTEIASLDDLTAAKKGCAAGDTSTLTIYRQGETMTLEITWGGSAGRTADYNADTIPAGDFWKRRDRESL